MNVQAEVSLYPLHIQEIREVVDSFVNVLERAGLTMHKENMSTTLSGDVNELFGAVGRAFTTVANGDQVVLVMKVSNACPSNGTVEQMNTDTG